MSETGWRDIVPQGMRCEADDGRGPDFGICHEPARGMVIHKGRERYVCAFHLKHYTPDPPETGAPQ